MAEPTRLLKLQTGEWLFPGTSLGVHRSTRGLWILNTLEDRKWTIWCAQHGLSDMSFDTLREVRKTVGALLATTDTPVAARCKITWRSAGNNEMVSADGSWHIYPSPRPYQYQWQRFEVEYLLRDRWTVWIRGHTRGGFASKRSAVLTAEELTYTRDVTFGGEMPT